MQSSILKPPLPCTLLLPAAFVEDGHTTKQASESTRQGMRTSLSMQCHAHVFFMLTACICFICRSASKGFSTSTASRCEPTVARDCLQRPGPCICIYIGYMKPLDSCIHAFFMRECMHPSALSLAWAVCGRRHRECPNAQDLQCRRIRV